MTEQITSHSVELHGGLFSFWLHLKYSIVIKATLLLKNSNIWFHRAKNAFRDSSAMSLIDFGQSLILHGIKQASAIKVTKAATWSLLYFEGFYYNCLLLSFDFHFFLFLSGILCSNSFLLFFFNRLILALKLFILASTIHMRIW